MDAKKQAKKMAKNYDNYTAIKAQFKAQNRKELREMIADIRGHWEAYKNSWRYREMLTQRQKAKPETEQRKILIEKITKEKDKNLLDFFQQCDTIAKAEAPKYIRISVDWVNSSVWGKNPHAEIWTEDGYFTGRASGCGYDKLSTAVAEALNKSNSILKLLYNKYEQALRKDKKANKCEVLGYGSGYSKPYFDGGVGYSSFQNIFNNLGATVNTWQSGRSYDCMEIRF
jgi:hypothetical protein